MLGLYKIVHSCLVLAILILDVDLTLEWDKKKAYYIVRNYRCVLTESLVMT